MSVMKQALQACVQASMRVHNSPYNGAFEYVNVHMCCVVNLCQLCMAAPLTSDHCVMEPIWVSDYREEGEAFQELGPLSIITLIKTVVCND